MRRSAGSLSVRRALVPVMILSFSLVPGVQDSAKGQSASGNALYQMCASEDASEPRKTCLDRLGTYMRAFATAQDAGMAQMHCAPAATTAEEASEAIVDYLRANPGKRPLREEVIFLAAMSATWPCSFGPVVLLDDGRLMLLAPPMRAGPPSIQE